MTSGKCNEQARRLLKYGLEEWSEEPEEGIVVERQTAQQGEDNAMTNVRQLAKVTLCLFEFRNDHYLF